MPKTKIPWADYTINPVKGLCPMACKDDKGKEYCYARRMYKRFKWNETIRWEPEHLIDLELMPNGSKVFIGSTMELFGAWIKERWLKDLLLYWIPRYPEHTFIFLTKQPQNLIKWSPFPDNCWVGVSVCNDKMLDVAVDKLEDISTSHKFLSIEPLLSRLTLSLDYAFYYSGIDWLILGSQTQPVRHPPREWVDEIISAADKAGIPVFVKEPMSSHFNIHRQEFPKGV